VLLDGALSFRLGLTLLERAPHEPAYDSCGDSDWAEHGHPDERSCTPDTDGKAIGLIAADVDLQGAVDVRARELHPAHLRRASSNLRTARADADRTPLQVVETPADTLFQGGRRCCESGLHRRPQCSGVDGLRAHQLAELRWILPTLRPECRQPRHRCVPRLSEGHAQGALDPLARGEPCGFDPCAGSRQALLVRPPRFGDRAGSPEEYRPLVQTERLVRALLQLRGETGDLDFQPRPEDRHRVGDRRRVASRRAHRHELRNPLAKLTLRLVENLGPPCPRDAVHVGHDAKDAAPEVGGCLQRGPRVLVGQARSAHAPEHAVRPRIPEQEGVLRLHLEALGPVKGGRTDAHIRAELCDPRGIHERHARRRPGRVHHPAHLVEIGAARTGGLQPGFFGVRDLPGPFDGHRIGTIRPAAPVQLSPRRAAGLEKIHLPCLRETAHGRHRLSDKGVHQAGLPDVALADDHDKQGLGGVPYALREPVCLIGVPKAAGVALQDREAFCDGLRHARGESGGSARVVGGALAARPASPGGARPSMPPPARTAGILVPISGCGRPVAESARAPSPAPRSTCPGRGSLQTSGPASTTRTRRALAPPPASPSSSPRSPPPSGGTPRPEGPEGRDRP